MNQQPFFISYIMETKYEKLFFNEIVHEHPVTWVIKKNQAYKDGDRKFILLFWSLVTPDIADAGKDL